LRNYSVLCWDRVIDDRPTGRLLTGVHRLGVNRPHPEYASKKH
jgi:hypothetical protein